MFRVLLTPRLVSKNRGFAKIVELVPALGESITEGTIARWNKKVGDMVNVDECVVIVETDKVTVDLKATSSGVITRLIAVDSVEVGKPLYEIDTDATSTTPAIISTVISSSSPPPSSSSPSSSIPVNHGRHPLIKFVGKRSLAKGTHTTAHTAHASNTPPLSQTTTLVSASPASSKPQLPLKAIKPGTGVDFTTLKGGAWFGRPRISAAEIAAIESGGASFVL